MALYEEKPNKSAQSSKKPGRRIMWTSSLPQSKTQWWAGEICI